MTEVTELSLDEINAADEANMTVALNGKLTTWVWTFAGPGHQQTIAQNNRLARDHLQKERLKEQARVNGKKWTAPEEDVEEGRKRNISWVVERLVRWTPIKIDGVDYEFSKENATALLSDPRKENWLTQAIDFLVADGAFTKRSVTN